MQRNHGLQVEWWEYYQVIRAWSAAEAQSRRRWRYQVWDSVELFNDGNNLELFKEAVKFIHRNRCKNSIATKGPGSGTVTCLRSRSSMIQMWRNRSVRHVTKHECDWKRERRGSVNVEEDQEVCDQCQTVEARSRQGETEEQTQVEDQVEEWTF